MTLDLLSNIALVVALGVVIQEVERRWGLDTLVAKVFSGALFALVTLVAMMTPVVLSDGLIFDGRSIILCTAGLLGGPVVALIAAVASIAYRIYLGGLGTGVGVAVIVESALLGTVYYYFRLRDKRYESVLYLYGLGLLVHAIMVAILLTLPDPERSMIISRVAVSILVFYPLATVLVARLLLRNEERTGVLTALEKSESSLRVSNANLEQMASELAESFASIVRVVEQVIEVRDPDTAGHQRRVSELSVNIAAESAMSSDQIEDIRIAGLIHDVGKMSVPAEILSKPGKLSAIEFDLIKCHAEAGYDILTSANIDTRITEMVRQHHERTDGSGYPRGLFADEILKGAKVLMVADVVEAMFSHRPYRQGLGLAPALAEIERGAHRQYDAEVVAACVTCFRERGFAFSEA